MGSNSSKTDVNAGLGDLVLPIMSNRDKAGTILRAMSVELSELEGVSQYLDPKNEYT